MKKLFLVIFLSLILPAAFVSAAGDLHPGSSDKTGELLMASLIGDLDRTFYPMYFERQLREEFGVSEDIEFLSDSDPELFITVYDLGLKDAIPEEIRVVGSEKITKLLSSKKPTQVVLAGKGRMKKIGDSEYFFDVTSKGSMTIKALGGSVGTIPISDESLVLTKDGHILQMKKVGR